jgi:pyruvate carboxylase subunit B
MRYVVEIAGRTLTVELAGEEVRVDGRAVGARLLGAGPVRRLLLGGRSLELVAAAGDGPDQWRIAVHGYRMDASVLDERARAARAVAAGAAHGGAAGTGAGAPAGSSVVRSPMPGLVVRLLVEEGQAVESGAGLVVVEAMKMENELRASGAGVVSRVAVRPGNRVEKGDVLVELRGR